MMWAGKQKFQVTNVGIEKINSCLLDQRSNEIQRKTSK